MTRTTQVEWHPDRPFVHFGSPPEVTYWRKDTKPKKKKKGKKRDSASQTHRSAP